MIVIAGCSHVFGSDLDDVSYPHPSKSVWPHLVADHFGEECVNISKIAAGNQAILRRTIITLNHMIEHGLDPSDITVLCQFSYFNRHELLHEDFQFCGSDFPYVTSKFMSDKLIPNSKHILDIIKHWFVAADPAYVYMSSFQACISLLMWAEKLGVKMFYTFTEDVPELNLPQYATVGDNHIGLSNFDKIHKSVAEEQFEVHEQHGLEVYEMKQSNRNFDVNTYVMERMFDNYKQNMLYFPHLASNWTDFCTAGNYSYKKRMWEQGDQKLRGIDMIKQTFAGERIGNGHWGEDAHEAAAKAFCIQLEGKI